MSKVLFGAFYEGDILYIEAYDVTNCISMGMNVVTVKPVSNKHPTTQEELDFRSQINQAIKNVADQFNEGSLGYQGPYKTSGNAGGFGRINRIKKMSKWAKFVLTELEQACVNNQIEFCQRDKKAKPITEKEVGKKGNKKVINFINTLDWVCKFLVNAKTLNAKTKHCFAAALQLGNAETNYRTWVKRVATHRVRAKGEKMNAENKALVKSIVDSIPFVA